MVEVMILARASIALFRSFDPPLSVTLKMTPSLWSTENTTSESWASSCLRSVRTMTESNTAAPSVPWRLESWLASQAMVFDLPEPAECCIR